MNKPLIILGNGGHASVLMETLLKQEQGYEIIGFTTPIMEDNVFGLVYLGPDEVIYNYNPEEVNLVLGLGMLGPSSAREKTFKHFKEKGYFFKSIIHPAAIISPSAQLGEGVQIMAGAIVQTGTSIADNTIINTGAIIDHDGQIGAHVHIAPGTKISGAVKIGKWYTYRYRHNNYSRYSYWRKMLDWSWICSGERIASSCKGVWCTSKGSVIND